MEFRKDKLGLLVLAALAALLPLAGCGGSGGSTTPTSNNTNSSGETISSLTSGYPVPSEISAVPESSTDTPAASLRSLSRAVADLAATTDYQKAIPAKYIEEPVLDQFEIIEEVLSALDQTRYYDSVNINQGPYKAMISWTENENGRDVKTLESWIVDSRMIVVEGRDINRVLCWIEEDEGVVKAEFKVHVPATFDEEGQVTSYGRWELNVKFDDTGTNFFVATAEPNGKGGVIIRINEHEKWSPNEPAYELKGVLNRSNSQGYGKVEFTDWESCDADPCQPTLSRAQYAYDAAYLGLKKTSDIEGTPIDEPLIYKNRTAKVPVTHQYGLFYDENPPQGAGISPGDNVRKHKRFGFPVFYTVTDPTTGDNFRRHAYYGAWQGRHELWADGGTVAPDTTVTKESWGQTEPEQFTVAAAINGSFTKRTLADADLADIKGVPVETWIDKHFELFYGDLNPLITSDTVGWYYCKGYVEWTWDEVLFTDVPVCKDFAGTKIDFTQFTDYQSLVLDSQNERKWVDIGGWDPALNGGTGGEAQYVYLDDNVGPNYQDYVAGNGNEGFYLAQRDSTTGQTIPVEPVQLYTPTDGANLWVSMGGSIYIAYTGPSIDFPTGWVQKKLESFDYDNWQPTFVAGADQPFSPQIGREYYLNANGVNYVVRRVSEANTPLGNIDADYEVKLEIQTTANPRNCNSTSVDGCTAIVPAAADYFRTPWDREFRYELITDENNANGDYLMLRYAYVDPASNNSTGATVGQVVNTGMWGLQAWSSGPDGIAGTHPGSDGVLGTIDDGTSDDYPIDASGNQVLVDQWGGVSPTETDRPVEFNWEYCDPTSGQNECWGAQTYLKDATTGDYVILDDPIMLNTPNGGLLTVKDWQGTEIAKSMMLQYDGWLHGLPDIHDTLRRNNWDISLVKDKIFNIPAGTRLVDNNNVGYLLKPLETSVFLEIVIPPAGEEPVVALATTIDLDAEVPDFTDHGMGNMPIVTKVKFSEGILVE